MKQRLAPFSLAVLIAATSVLAHAQAEVLQADCGSIIVNGSVINSTVEAGFCGVPAAALERLISQLEVANLARDAAEAKADLWVERYYDLNERLASVSDLNTSELVAAADLLGQGDLDRAEQEISALESAFEKERQSNRDQTRAVLRELAEAGMEPGGVVDYARVWKSSPITICFLNGAREVRQHVSRIARQWTLFGNIDFDFGTVLDPRSCNDADHSQVRIDLSGPGFWSYVGVGHLTAPRPNPTMGLSLNDKSEIDIQSGKFDGQILHEFGHLLGLYHIYGHPDLNCQFNHAYVYKHLSGPPNFWSTEKIDMNIFNPLRLDTVLTGVVDYNSIMQFTFPPEFFIDSQRSPCYSPSPVRKLSILDKLAVYRTYPDG